jgi:signal transduction histidine kinase
MFGGEPANVAAVEAILDSINASVWAVRPDGQLCYGNRRWWEYSALPPARRDLSGCLRVVHPDERAVANAAWTAALERAEPSQMRYRLRRASDHSYRWHLCRVLPVTSVSGEGAGWILVATDIHELMILAGDGPARDQDLNVRRLRALLQNAPVPLALYEGPWHQCVFANDAARQAIDAAGGDAVGSFPELDGQVRRLFDDAYAQGQAVAVKEWPVRTAGPDQQGQRFFDFVLQPTRDATGNVFGIVGAGTDVTGPVRARQALEQTAARLSRLQAMATALADVLDPARAAQIAADQTRAAAGADWCTVMVSGNGAPQRLASSGDAEAAAEPAAELALPLGTEERAAGTLRLGFAAPHHPDQDERAYLEALARQAGQAIERAQLYHAAESARREATLQRERLARVIREAPVPMAVFRGPDLAIELGNPRWEGLFGPAGAEALPHDLRTAMRAAFSSGEAGTVAEVAAGAGGTETFHNVTVQPSREVDGETGEVILVAAEVTEQVQTRRTLHEELAAHQASGRREADLLAEERATRTRVEQDNRAKDEFLALLGHELRNPLAPIVVALQLLRMRGASDQVRELGIIERQVQHLVRLVDDLLDVSRITRGMIRLRKERVELAPVVSKAVEMASPLLEQREQHLIVDVPATDCLLDADKDRLAQVIANLLTNAAKYTPPRGHIRVSAALEGHNSDRAMTIRVQDDGRGMAPELLAVVFDMFVQGNRPIDRSEGGLGLGLTLVRTLVELHGGTVTAHSAGVGQGSEFVIRLPCAAAAEDRADAMAAPPAATGPRRRVLVVDDNADVVEVVSELLRISGYEVAVAHDPAEALRVAGPFQPDVAVLDIGLPVMDGYELARRLRLGNPGLRLVAVTGYGQAQDRERSRSAGFQEHLVKPIDGDVLLAAVAAKAE